MNRQTPENTTFDIHNVLVNHSGPLISESGIKTKDELIDLSNKTSIRSFLIGAICLNISSVKNVLESEDVFSTIKCLKKLGVKIRKISPKNYLVYGKGLGSLWAKKNTELNFGNSGTLARLLVGILSTTPGLELKIKGDNSLNNRNMKKLIELMSEFGAFFLPKRKLRIHQPCKHQQAKAIANPILRKCLALLDENAYK